MPDPARVPVAWSAGDGTHSDPVARELTRARLFGGPQPCIGRYAVRGILGVGGMGVVYRVHDGALDRDVALKMLSGGGGERREARLQREAQALARLSHPNVVAVFDFGRAFGRFFLTMEMIDGPTMRQWQRGRSIAEIVEAYAAAGQGLAAAHAAGLLHRDLKPDNILIGSDGRPRVADFGLVADGPTEESEALADRAVPTPRDARPDVSALAGTPAYMSPEQLRREPLDARSDVFSFCVALFEAVSGALPFAGATAETRARNLLAGRVDWTRVPRKVPQWLREVLATGLANAPGARFASANDFLVALERGPRRRWPRFAAIVAVIGIVAWSVRDVEPDDPCTTLPELVSWDTAGTTRIAESFARGQPSYGAAAWSAVVPQIDEYARAWKQARAEVCAAGSVRSSDRAVMCLRRAQEQLAATLEWFARGEPTAVERAGSVVAGLPTIEACVPTDGAVAGASQPLDVEARARLLALDRKVTELWTRVDQGYSADFDAEAEALLAEALADADPGLRARAWLVRAKLFDRHLRHAEAASALADAYFAASEAGLPEETARAATALVGIHGIELGDPLLGLEWANHAQGALERMGLDPRQMWSLRHARIAVLTQANRLDEAEAEVRDVVAALAATDPTKTLHWLGVTTEDLGRLMLARGRPSDARAEFERVAELARMEYGPEHPRVGTALLNLAQVQNELGEGAAAERGLRDVMRLFTNAYGKDSPRLAPVLNNLANTITDPARTREALAVAQESLRLSTLAGFSPHKLSEVHHGLGNLYQRLGELDTAASHYEQERVAIEMSLGGDDPEVGHALHSLGRVNLARRHYDEARTLFDRTLVLWRNAYGADHPLVAFPLQSLGELALLEHRPAEAVPMLREAMALRLAHPGPPVKLAQTRFALARALWDSSGDRSEAIGLAQLSRAVYAAAPEVKATDVDELEEWLRDHRADTPRVVLDRLDRTVDRSRATPIVR